MTGADQIERVPLVAEELVDAGGGQGRGDGGVEAARQRRQPRRPGGLVRHRHDLLVAAARKQPPQPLSGLFVCRSFAHAVQHSRAIAGHGWRAIEKCEASC